MKFEDMNIEKSVLGSLKEMGFREPTRIQMETIPLIKKGYDVVGQSETGSGKTAAFGIPLIEKVAKGGKIQALVLVPTRELCLQIAGEFEKLSKFKGLKIEAVYGGVSIENQISGLRKAEIVVGTPGRIIDHIKRKTINLVDVKIFVLDEADKMIDMGFIDDIKEIEEHLPKKRQMLLFSATMPESLIEIRDRLTKNPIKVKTSTKVKEDILKQYYYDVDFRKKFSLLAHVIRQEDPRLAIVFCNSRRDAEYVSNNLKMNGIDAVELHGGLSQKKREDVIKMFQQGKKKILVATDVASRGIDIKDVTHVFNYSIPKNPEDYVNRIGRTARIGNSGKAFCLLCKDDHESFRRITNLYSYNIERLERPEFKDLGFQKGFSKRLGFFGRRKNKKPFKKENFSRRPYSLDFSRDFSNFQDATDINKKLRLKF